MKDEVCGLYELSHDGDQDELGGLGVGCEALGEGLQAGVAAAGGHGGVFPDTEAGLRALPGLRA